MAFRYLSLSAQEMTRPAKNCGFCRVDFFIIRNGVFGINICQGGKAVGSGRAVFMRLNIFVFHYWLGFPAAKTTKNEHLLIFFSLHSYKAKIEGVFCSVFSAFQSFSPSCCCCCCSWLLKFFFTRKPRAFEGVGWLATYLML